MIVLLYYSVTYFINFLCCNSVVWWMWQDGVVVKQFLGHDNIDLNRSDK